jgi:hypothetical protein
MLWSSVDRAAVRAVACQQGYHLCFCFLRMYLFRSPGLTPPLVQNLEKPLSPTGVRRLPVQELPGFPVRRPSSRSRMFCRDGQRGSPQKCGIHGEPDRTGGFVIHDIHNPWRPVQCEQGRARRILDMQKGRASLIGGQLPKAHLLRDRSTKSILNSMPLVGHPIAPSATPVPKAAASDVPRLAPMLTSTTVRGMAFCSATSVLAATLSMASACARAWLAWGPTTLAWT